METSIYMKWRILRTIITCKGMIWYRNHFVLMVLIQYKNASSDAKYIPKYIYLPHEYVFWMVWASIIMKLWRHIKFVKPLFTENRKSKHVLIKKIVYWAPKFVLTALLWRQTPKQKHSLLQSCDHVTRNKPSKSTGT